MNTKYSDLKEMSWPKIIGAVVLLLLMVPLSFLLILVSIGWATALTAQWMGMDLTNDLLVYESALAMVVFVGYFIIVPAFESEFSQGKDIDPSGVKRKYFKGMLAAMLTGFFVPIFMAMLTYDDQYQLFSAGIMAPLFGYLMASTLETFWETGKMIYEKGWWVGKSGQVSE
ncbi:MAG: hypothetical protein KDD89_00735 [Anaerolineales bacterium]|nr:hypothetical protein [Anaerolineales bacterium]